MTEEERENLKVGDMVYISYGERKGMMGEVTRLDDHMGVFVKVREDWPEKRHSFRSIRTMESYVRHGSANSYDSTWDWPNLLKLGVNTSKIEYYLNTETGDPQIKTVLKAVLNALDGLDSVWDRMGEVETCVEERKHRYKRVYTK